MKRRAFLGALLAAPVAGLQALRLAQAAPVAQAVEWTTEWPYGAAMVFSEKELLGTFGWQLRAAVDGFAADVQADLRRQFTADMVGDDVFRLLREAEAEAALTDTASQDRS